jgi:hypothetical protein
VSGDHVSPQFFSFVARARIRDRAADAGVGPHRRRFHMNGSSRLGALALMITLSAHAAHAKDLFVVEGYETLTSPRLLSEGRYEELIEQSSPHGWRDPTKASFAATNLCVAHIKTAQLEAARASCDAAIVAARSHRRASSMGTHERWLAMARAYSSRAVLRWLSGRRHRRILRRRRAMHPRRISSAGTRGRCRLAVKRVTRSRRCSRSGEKAVFTRQARSFPLWACRFSAEVPSCRAPGAARRSRRPFPS